MVHCVHGYTSMCFNRTEHLAFYGLTVNFSSCHQSQALTI